VATGSIPPGTGLTLRPCTHCQSTSRPTHTSPLLSPPRSRRVSSLLHSSPLSSRSSSERSPLCSSPCFAEPSLRPSAASCRVLPPISRHPRRRCQSSCGPLAVGGGSPVSVCFTHSTQHRWCIRMTRPSARSTSFSMSSELICWSQASQESPVPWPTHVLLTACLGRVPAAILR